MRLARPLAVILTLLALAAGGCAQRETAPVLPPLQRDVTVMVLDSLGAPVPWLDVTAIGAPPASGVVPYSTHTTGPDAEAVFQLGEGTWTLSTGTFPEIQPMELRQVAGCTMIVPGRSSRPARDTLVVRMPAMTPSRIRGTVLLSGFERPQYTDVWMKDCGWSGARTNLAGAFVLEGVPAGTWTLVCERAGYARSQRTIVVPAPGSDVLLPTVTLHP